MSTELYDFIAMVKQNEYVILDTETTGLDTGEVCQIAIIDSAGTALIDTLVKPVGGIPQAAAAIHGITNMQVIDAPGWKDVSPRVQTILTGRNVIAYNAVFDRKMMHRSAEAAALPPVDWKSFSTWWCAMLAFSQVYAQRDRYGRGFRWQKLATAAQFYGIKIANEHNALADCLTTLHVIKSMAGV